VTDEERCARCGAVLAPRGGGEASCVRCLLALGLSPAGASPDSDPARSPVDKDPARPSEGIGPFRILDTLGSGVLGVVYLAEPSPPEERNVALKVVPAGPDARAALTGHDAVRPALARLDHPVLARVLGSGMAEDGRAWFATEFVPGVPITEHCDRERLPVRPRLELFADVCEAVDHAHTRGVLHGNLKPSNVLVTEEEGRPRPRVLDLGLATALLPKRSEQTLYTAAGLLAGPPGHLSPEQLEARPDVDARSDVYSLGVMLYELLCGTPPFEPRRLRQGGWAEMVRVIQQEEPARPSARLAARAGPTADEVGVRRQTDPRRLAQELRGAPDGITLKALEKDPARRYSSAGELAADLRRHLSGGPVTAHSPGRIRHLGQVAVRHKLALAAAAAVLLALLLGLTLGR